MPRAYAVRCSHCGQVTIERADDHEDERMARVHGTAAASQHGTECDGDVETNEITVPERASETKYGPQGLADGGEI